MTCTNDDSQSARVRLAQSGDEVVVPDWPLGAAIMAPAAAGSCPQPGALLAGGSAPVSKRACSLAPCSGFDPGNWRAALTTGQAPLPTPKPNLVADLEGIIEASHLQGEEEERAASMSSDSGPRLRCIWSCTTLRTADHWPWSELQRHKRLTAPRVIRLLGLAEENAQCSARHTAQAGAHHHARCFSCGRQRDPRRRPSSPVNNGQAGMKAVAETGGLSSSAHIGGGIAATVSDGEEGTRLAGPARAREADPNRRWTTSCVSLGEDGRDERTFAWQAPFLCASDKKLSTWARASRRTYLSGSAR